jgi:ribosomal-protein-alanine N-acetyltransferase
MNLAAARPQDAAAMAQAHAAGFDTPWSEEEFEALLEGEGIYGFFLAGPGPEGVVLCRIAAQEMEVLTLAVAPGARSRGLGKALMRAALEQACTADATSAFLEVAVDNVAASALYASLGFRRVGVRKAYYDRGQAGHADAWIMRLDLDPAPT